MTITGGKRGVLRNDWPKKFGEGGDQIFGKRKRRGGWYPLRDEANSLPSGVGGPNDERGSPYGRWYGSGKR